eukprot:6172177-Pleurochrysis_carterae.AAC.1
MVVATTMATATAITTATDTESTTAGVTTATRVSLSMPLAGQHGIPVSLPSATLNHRCKSLLPVITASHYCQSALPVSTASQHCHHQRRHAIIAKRHAAVIAWLQARRSYLTRHS